jgi:hypothetical protein
MTWLSINTHQNTATIIRSVAATEARNSRVSIATRRKSLNWTAL